MTAHVQLADQLCFSVYHVNQLFNKFYQDALSPYGLTYPQYLVLTVLWDRQPLELHELGRRLHLSSNTLTPLVRRLAQNGWVTRTRPQTDKRRLLVGLTAKGRQAEPAVHQTLAECLGSRALSLADYRQALALNQKVIAALQD